MPQKGRPLRSNNGKLLDLSYFAATIIEKEVVIFSLTDRSHGLMMLLFKGMEINSTQCVGLVYAS